MHEVTPLHGESPAQAVTAEVARCPGGPTGQGCTVCEPRRHWHMPDQDTVFFLASGRRTQHKCPSDNEHKEARLHSSALTREEAQTPVTAQIGLDIVLIKGHSHKGHMQQDFVPSECPSLADPDRKKAEQRAQKRTGVGGGAAGG